MDYTAQSRLARGSWQSPRRALPEPQTVENIYPWDGPLYERRTPCPAPLATLPETPGTVGNTEYNLGEGHESYPLSHSYYTIFHPPAHYKSGFDSTLQIRSKSLAQNHNTDCATRSFQPEATVMG